MGYVSAAGALLLAGYLALFFAAWGWLANRTMASASWTKKSLGSRQIASSASRPPRNDMLLILPAAWVVLEYLRSVLLTGFGWNPLAHTQWKWPEVIQLAELTGAWGISFLVVLVNVALFQFLRRDVSARSRRWAAFAGLTLLGLTAGYGWLRLPGVGSYPSGTFRVCLVQGNIPQTHKWDEAFREEIWQRYERLTQEAARANPQVLVWPETAAPNFLEEPDVRGRLERVARSAAAALLAGVPTERLSSGLLYNSAVLLDGGSRQVDRYDKLHLVPFGEYVPLKLLFGWLENVVPIGDFSPGERFTVFQLPPPAARGAWEVSRFSVLICFEDLFPGLARTFVREGARWLVVITNDGWFGRSAASLQHLQASVLRAVENRVWVARAANTGWTGFVDPAGRRRSAEPVSGLRPAIPRFEPGVAAEDLPSYTVTDESLSLYTRWGDWFPALCGLLAVGLSFLPSKRKL